MLIIYALTARIYCMVRDLNNPGFGRCLRAVLAAWGWLVLVALLMPQPGVWAFGCSLLGLLICVLVYSRMLSNSDLKAVALYFAQVVTITGFWGALFGVFLILGISTQPS